MDTQCVNKILVSSMTVSSIMLTRYRIHWAGLPIIIPNSGAENIKKVWIYVWEPKSQPIVLRQWPNYPVDRNLCQKISTLLITGQVSFPEFVIKAGVVVHGQFLRHQVIKFRWNSLQNKTHFHCFKINFQLHLIALLFKQRVKKRLNWLHSIYFHVYENNRAVKEAI